MDIDFFLNRLKRMSIKEVFYRLNNLVIKHVEKFVFSKITFNSNIIGSSGALFKKEFETDSFSSIIDRADQFCDNKIDILALKSFNYGEEIEYHKDYKSGKSSPQKKFGKSIDYRDSNNNGDIKYIWEPNRQLFTPILAIAYNQTHDRKYINKLKEYISKWIIQNPFMLGLNWSSSLELAIRLINWSVSWKLVESDLDKEFMDSFLDTIYRHCWFINNNLSRYSSANNHLIGEAAGLFIGSVLFPKFDKSKMWIEKSRKILEEESMKQIYNDGVNKEQTISYQQFVFDLLLLAGLIGKNNGIEFSKEYWDQIKKMSEFIVAISDFNFNVPHLGDEDDGFVIDFGQRSYGIYKSIRNTSAYVFGTKGLLCKDVDIDIKTNFIFSIIGAQSEEKDCSTIPYKFDEGGYYILCLNNSSSKEQKLLFDCGNLGYLSLAAHGHADALSFCFSASGQPIFIDPGTYSYHSNKEWRNYFRGTAAHNTVRVDNLNQSTITGNFMWGQKAHAKLLKYINDISVSGIHDGYNRLSGNVEHIREIYCDRNNDEWIITDRITGKGTHLAEVFFHLNPECRVTIINNNKIDITFSKGHIYLEHFEQGKFEIFEGSRTPLSGWYSPSFDIIKPTKTVLLKCNFIDEVTIKTKYSVKFNED